MSLLMIIKTAVNPNILQISVNSTVQLKQNLDVPWGGVQTFALYTLHAAWLMPFQMQFITVSNLLNNLSNRRNKSSNILKSITLFSMNICMRSACVIVTLRKGFIVAALKHSCGERGMMREEWWKTSVNLTAMCEKLISPALVVSTLNVVMAFKLSLLRMWDGNMTEER